MSVQGLSENDMKAGAVAVPAIPASAALPEAPLAMPMQSLDAGGIIGFLRGIFGNSGRVVKH